MYIIIFVTASSKKEAAAISKKLIKNKLAACVNIIDKIKSLFWWKGKIDTAGEALLVIKTKKSKLTKIIGLISSMHSYDVPEIIAIPVIAGSSSYLRWIDASLR